MISVNVTRIPCVCYEDEYGEIVASEECFSGPNISDSLILTEAVAVARGTSLINQNSTDRVRVSGDMHLDDYMKPGTRCLFSDSEKGDFNSIILQSSIDIRKNKKGSYNAEIKIQLEREE